MVNRYLSVSMVKYAAGDDAENTLLPEEKRFLEEYEYRLRDAYARVEFWKKRLDQLKELCLDSFRDWWNDNLREKQEEEQEFYRELFSPSTDNT